MPFLLQYNIRVIFIFFSIQYLFSGDMICFGARWLLLAQWYNGGVRTHESRPNSLFFTFTSNVDHQRSATSRHNPGGGGLIATARPRACHVPDLMFPPSTLSSAVVRCGSSTLLLVWNVQQQTQLFFMTKILLSKLVIRSSLFFFG